MLTLVLGLAAVLRPLPVTGRVRDYAFGATLAGGLGAVSLADGQLGRTEGAILVATYVTLVVAVWRREQQPPAIGELGEALDDERRLADHAGRGLILALAGIAVMATGGILAVQGAERVVAALSRTDTAVGLTLVALATTAELLALVWSSARRNVNELAVAAVVGSAAYNATATLGAAALVHPASHINLRTSALVAACLPLLVLLVAGRGRHLNHVGGLGLVAGYTMFVASRCASTSDRRTSTRVAHKLRVWRHSR